MTQLLPLMDISASHALLLTAVQPQKGQQQGWWVLMSCL
jgi:hypothetical protein